MCYLSRRSDRTTIARRLRVSVEAVARVIQAYVPEQLGEARLKGLFRTGFDEVSRPAGTITRTRNNAKASSSYLRGVRAVPTGDRCDIVNSPAQLRSVAGSSVTAEHPGTAAAARRAMPRIGGLGLPAAACAVHSQQLSREGSARVLSAGSVTPRNPPKRPR